MLLPEKRNNGVAVRAYGRGEERRSDTLSSYALPTRCPVLTGRMVMSGTHITCGAMLSAYTMFGADLQYDATLCTYTMCGTDIWYGATTRVEKRIVLLDIRYSARLSACAGAIRCPVLTSAIMLRACYSMSGTDLGCAATRSLVLEDRCLVTLYKSVERTTTSR
eukprot:3941966-Rhodomonas_salina.2